MGIIRKEGGYASALDKLYISRYSFYHFTMKFLFQSSSIILVALFSLASISQDAIGQSLGDKNSIIVILKDDAAKKALKCGDEFTFCNQKITSLQKTLQVKKTRRLSPLYQTNTYVINFDNDIDVNVIIKKYMESGIFSSVSKNYGENALTGSSMVTQPTDDLYYKQWYLNNPGGILNYKPGESIPAKVGADINMELAWDLEQGDAGITVAILDTGIDYLHPELDDRVWYNTDETNGTSDLDNNGYVGDWVGWDFTIDNNDPFDDHGHGTLVTSIIGTERNGTNYVGVDWNCKLMGLKVVKQNNTFQYADYAEAIYYAVANGARVINMSLRSVDFNQAIEDALEFAHQNNVVVVVAMGNDGNSTTHYMCQSAYSISVGSTGTEDKRTVFSNYNTYIDLVAPGRYMYGLNYEDHIDDQFRGQGTSFSAPLVAGAVSLLLAQDPTRTVEEIRTILHNTADDQVGFPDEDVSGFDQFHGYGRLNVFAALSEFNICIDQAGMACDDGDICTENDVYDGSCNCAGTFADSDQDLICDQDDLCPGFDDFIDTDNDGIPNGCDDCNNNLAGTACDDSDHCTINDVYDSNCDCAGIYMDEDNDGVCVGNDADDTNPCVPNISLEECPLQQCTNFDDTSFENGDYGAWIFGVGDAVPYSANANTGSFAARLRDNSGQASSIYTQPINANGMTGVRINFSFLLVSYEFSEDFFLEISTDGGNNFDIIDRWISGTDVSNNIRYYEEVVISDYTLSGQTVLRFRSDASSNADYVYIDDIVVALCSGQGISNCQEGAACDDGNACTINEVYDENCDCVGTVQDADSDGICDAEDSCPSLHSGLIGSPCDDGDICTVSDVYVSEICGCAGTYIDADSDGVCIGLDPNDNDACIPIGDDCAGMTCNVIMYDDFEAGMGNWNSGGSDAIRYDSNPNSGSYALRIRDNSGVGSSAFTNILNVSSYAAITVRFSFLAVSMESSENFYLEVSNNGGSSFAIVEEWVSGTDFSNYQRINTDEIEISGNLISGSTVIRFRCDASSNSDLVYIDDIVIGACIPGTNGEDDGGAISGLESDGDAISKNAMFDFIISPNPANKVLRVKVQDQNSSLIDSYNLSIFNMEGALILQNQLQSNDGLIETGISKLQSGQMYVTRLIDYNGTHHYKKFIKI